MDRFDAMRVFARIVERRSFTRAADDLALPRATVTDAIKALESRLGVRLLQRTTRQVTPTLEGEVFYGRCLRLIADMEDAEGAFRDTRPRGPLRIEVHGTLARLLLFPRLPAFLDAYPDIELDVSEGDRYVDLVREGVDCAVRVGKLRDSDLIARRLTLLAEATAASPDYCKRHGTPTDIDALQGDGHVMVGFKSTAIGALLPLEFQHERRVRHVTLPTRVRVSGADSYVGAAFAGFGIIQAPRYRLDDYFATGKLIPLLELFPPLPSPVNIVYTRTRLPSPRLRAFIEWASNTFAAEDN
ncbi:DNA-binding transcriptional regulator, LysR family [Azotobacter beijerinckii]|jgi:DNA-binding transcriptional LysR family regulator|uniref:DNA-binding transcriptional regulator, LysR family n=1 Tax=Azotobacter beijerinckii TaxID=170623 RepID=A0A1H9T976_9GAMM|nr:MULTISPECIES: LysR substrate-binding domain-containing protein [Azotobacter]ASL28843.1 transcriptional regulator [Azotobacter chroococcum]SEJ50483.1 DNA-binding transcriptional regulator, LysR family [Azotobacter beijerinckii]SER93494.1 DNA-binding transcriptional regulator, LysR family [Azotobacter beijerinckii]